MLKNILTNRLFLGALVCLILLCAGFLFYLSHVERQGQLKPNTKTKPPPWNASVPLTLLRNVSLLLTPQGKRQPISEEASAETRAERGRARLTELHQAMGTADHPYTREIQKAINSPAFVEFQKHPFSVKRWFDFLESQGVKSYRNMYMENWERLFPDSDLSAYTEVVRDQLVEEFLSTTLVGQPGSIERRIQIIKIYDEVLQSSDKNSTWHNATFMLDENPEAWVDWAVDIAENLYSSEQSALEDVESVLRPAENTATVPLEVAEKTMIEDVESVLRTEDDEKKAPLEILNLSSEYREDIESALITEIRTPFLESVFQQFQQNEHFSQQRFNAAVQTLSQHGPEEGLRRLKESDPEIATQIEKFIQSNTEAD